MPERCSRIPLARVAIFLALMASVSGCSSVPSAVRNAPGLNMLFGDDKPVFGIDPTEEAGLDYEIETRGLGVGDTPDETAENKRIQTILEGATRLYRLQDKPPPNIALLKRRASSDVDIIERALKSEGYYEGEATITVISEKAASPETAPSLDDNGEIIEDVESVETLDTPIVKVSVRKGPRYALARQLATFATPIDPLLEQTIQDAVSVNVGGPAQGRAVVDAEVAASRIFGTSGYPYAKKGTRRAEANFDFDTIDIRTPYAPGPLTTYGDVTFEGLETVEQKYVKSFVTWQRGAPISRKEIADVQRELSATRLFDAVSIVLPEEPPEGWEQTGRFTAPVKIVFEESKHRKATVGLSYSTTTGPGGVATWEHRNLFGQNETLLAVLDISLEEQRARLDYRKPRWQKPERDLLAGFEVFHEDTEAFESFGATGSVGIEERLSDQLTVTASLAGEAVQIRESDGRKRDSYLLGLPFTAVYDGTDDLLNPTEGVRITALATPWVGSFDEEVTVFGETDLEASTYISLDRDANYIFAVRGRIAQIFADDADNIPANRRVFAGGGGSVRAYAEQFVNDLDEDGVPDGALGVYEGSIEMRMRFGNFGVVPFVDAGIVSNEFFSDYGTLRWGPGLGLRYFSPVGPIRLDVAVPIDPRDEDDNFQFYLSIGQAF